MITTLGADPSRELEEFAEKTVGKSKYQELAMGGGQQEAALNMLREASRQGHWLCLKNLHLVVAWLPVLEKELAMISPHENFRLWLTTESHDKFPPLLLQESLKITYESPPGVKKNIQRTYDSWGADFIERGPTQRAHLLFSLAWFHAIVQERRNYIPQGWTKFYEFSLADLRTASTIIDVSLNQSATPDWVTLHGIMETAIYGGRVDNIYDLRVLKTYLRHFFQDNLFSSRGSHFLPQGLSLPNSTTMNDYYRLLTDLPDSDEPSMFGLPANIDRAIQRTKSTVVLAQMKALQRPILASFAFDREHWRSELGPLLDLWEKLTASTRDVLSPPPSSSIAQDSLSPVDNFVILEAGQAQELVVFIHDALEAIKRVVYGTAMLTPIIQSQGTALLMGDVPVAWTKRWEGTENPQEWLRGLVVRKLALVEWIKKVNSRSLLESPISMSDLFHPETFLNALRQQTARHLSCSMDSLKLVSSWDASRITSKSSIVISNLLLQGAEFNGNALSDAPSDAPELVSVPPVTISWIPKGEAEPYTERNSITIPVYFTTDREKLLTQVNIHFFCNLFFTHIDQQAITQDF